MNGRGASETASRPTLLCVTGTTGTGKNEIGARVARRLGGEVVSLDSMKVYRGMDIGTAKPDAATRALAPHHLLDVVDPSERMDLSRFTALAEAAVADVAARGGVPVCVGGTAMYWNGLLYGVHRGPSRDEGFREALRAERDALGVAALHARLAALDPEAAGRIDPADYRRIERALEIRRTAAAGDEDTGDRTWFRTPRYPARVLVLTWPRETLRRRIEARVDAMLEAGWLDEVARIRATCGFSEAAMMALGYRELLAVLDGALDPEAARARIKVKTWQFARRQLTWMRKYPDATWIVLTPDDDPESVAARITYGA